MIKYQGEKMDNGNMKRIGIVFLICLLFLINVFLTGCTEDSDNDRDTESSIYMVVKMDKTTYSTDELIAITVEIVNGMNKDLEYYISDSGPSIKLSISNKSGKSVFTNFPNDMMTEDVICDGSFEAGSETVCLSVSWNQTVDMYMYDSAEGEGKAVEPGEYMVSITSRAHGDFTIEAVELYITIQN